MKKTNGLVSRFYVYIHHDPAVVSVTVATRSICNHPSNWLCCDGNAVITHFKSKHSSL